MHEPSDGAVARRVAAAWRRPRGARALAAAALLAASALAGARESLPEAADPAL
jgi:hypothetical protein